MLDLPTKLLILEELKSNYNEYSNPDWPAQLCEKFDVEYNDLERYILYLTNMDCVDADYASIKLNEKGLKYLDKKRSNLGGFNV